MRGWMLLALASAGCALPRDPSGDGLYRISGVAEPNSLLCSQREVASLGYQVTWFEGGEGLRAERRMDESETESSRAYLTVTLSREPRGEVLNVSAERIAETSRLPLPSNPTPRPQPTPMPGVRRSTPRRLSPGVAAGHARSVLRRCTGAAAAVVE
jgi:hypothetical protein